MPIAPPSASLIINPSFNFVYGWHQKVGVNEPNAGSCENTSRTSDVRIGEASLKVSRDDEGLAP